jgi:predicted RNA-binding protein with RPS1 domain
MGGKAAKERRRLERMEKQGDAGRASQEAKELKKSVFKTKEPHRNGESNTRPPFKKVNTAGAADGATIRSKVIPKGKNHTKAKFVTKKKVDEPKKTFKKPKHLKRKLEQTEDDAVKEKVLTELQKLEERKKLFSVNQPSKKQRTDKGTHSKPMHVTPTLQPPSIKKDNKQKVEKLQPLSRHQKNPKSNAPPRFEKKEDSKQPSKTTKTSIKNSSALRSADEPVLVAEPITFEHKVAEAPIESATSPGTSDTTSTMPKPIPKEESPAEKQLTLKAKDTTNGKSEGKKNADDDSGDSDGSEDDDDDVDALVSKRQRGRRRKGQLDTDKRTKAPNEVNETTSEVIATEEGKKSKSDGKARRCIGRKPVTDFTVGQRYPGKVVYIKPFGVFIDINCHSEVFCHVSRVQDDFVKTPEEVLKIGDDVNPRVVEIDREKKRITVSLQSDQRFADEKASADAHFERASKRRRNKSKLMSDDREKAEVKVPEAAPEDPDANATISANDLVDAEGNFLKEESDMSPAELKRARKLARRAQRRTQLVDVDTS